MSSSSAARSRCRKVDRDDDVRAACESKEDRIAVALVADDAIRCERPAVRTARRAATRAGRHPAVHGSGARIATGRRSRVTTSRHVTSGDLLRSLASSRHLQLAARRRNVVVDGAAGDPERRRDLCRRLAHRDEPQHLRPRVSKDPAASACQRRRWCARPTRAANASAFVQRAAASGPSSPTSQTRPPALARGSTTVDVDIEPGAVPHDRAHRARRSCRRHANDGCPRARAVLPTRPAVRTMSAPARSRCRAGSPRTRPRTRTRLGCRTRRRRANADGPRGRRRRCRRPAATRARSTTGRRTGAPRLDVAVSW